jgi:hypothetical protein
VCANPDDYYQECDPHHEMNTRLIADDDPDADTFMKNGTFVIQKESGLE